MNDRPIPRSLFDEIDRLATAHRLDMTRSVLLDHRDRHPDVTGNELDDSIAQLVDQFGFDRVEAAVGRVKKQMAGPIPQVGVRDGDQRTAQGHRSADVRRFGRNSHSGRLLALFAGADLTDGEAADLVMSTRRPYTVAQWEGCRRRCSDLREAGYLSDTGTERDGRIVWTITPEGRTARARMLDTGWSR